MHYIPEVGHRISLLAALSLKQEKHGFKNGKLGTIAERMDAWWSSQQMFINELIYVIHGAGCYTLFSSFDS